MNYRNITTDRQFRDTTSYGKSEFSALLSDYEATYKELYGCTYEEYIEENVMEIPKLRTLGDALFFYIVSNEE